MLHQVGVSFDLYYDARKQKIKKFNKSANGSSKVQFGLLCQACSAMCRRTATANLAGGQFLHEEPKRICEASCMRPKTHIIRMGRKRV